MTDVVAVARTAVAKQTGVVIEGEWREERENNGRQYRCIPREKRGMAHVGAAAAPSAADALLDFRASHARTVAGIAVRDVPLSTGWPHVVGGMAEMAGHLDDEVPVDKGAPSKGQPPVTWEGALLDAPFQDCGSRTATEKIVFYIHTHIRLYNTPVNSVSSAYSARRKCRIDVL